MYIDALHACRNVRAMRTRIAVRLVAMAAASDEINERYVAVGMVAAKVCMQIGSDKDKLLGDVRTQLLLHLACLIRDDCMQPNNVLSSLATFR